MKGFWDFLLKKYKYQKMNILRYFEYNINVIGCFLNIVITF